MPSVKGYALGNIINQAQMSFGSVATPSVVIDAGRSTTSGGGAPETNSRTLSFNATRRERYVLESFVTAGLKE
jgi:hypothetical protein